MRCLFNQPKLSDLSRIIGFIISALPKVRYMTAHYGYLERDKAFFKCRFLLTFSSKTFLENIFTEPDVCYVSI